MSALNTNIGCGATQVAQRLREGKQMFQCRHLTFIAAAAFLVSACAGTPLPQPGTVAGNATSPPVPASQSLDTVASTGRSSTPAEPARVTSKGPGASQENVAAQQEAIIGLKKDTIVLYRDEHGFEGERMVAGSFTLPTPARRASNNPQRLEILTAVGMRWVERAEVLLGASGR